MNNQKGIKILAATSVVVMLGLNLITLNLLSDNDRKIDTLTEENQSIKAKLNYVAEELPKLEKGLVNVYTDSNMSKSVLKKLIDKLDDYDYIEPITLWGDENEVIDFSR